MLLSFAFFSMFTGKVPALEPGSIAPPFELKTDKGTEFKLEDRRGRWTVLYFYPKDETPGCTKQACAFRDSIDVIRQKSAEVYGISKDTVESHRKFVENHKLNFTILADADGTVIEKYGAKGFLGMAKRWTFIVDPQLKIAWINTDVDPARDPKVVADQLEKLQKR